MQKLTNNHFDEKKKMWGENIEKLSQIGQVFINYLQGKIKKFPFAEGALQPETTVILEPLIKMNSNYFFTINS